MTPYPAYKPTGLPWLPQIPEHWEIKKLRTLLSVVSEKGHPDAPLLSVVRERGVIIRNTEDNSENHNYIPDELTNYKYVRKGQFAMNKMKAWQGSYGISNFDGIVSPAYFVFNLKEVTKNFFNLAIRSKFYVPYFGQASDGIRVGQWDLSIPRMKEIPFAVPTVDEQVQIVRYLDSMTAKINKLIHVKKKQIALLQEQKRAIINQAVTKGLNPDAEMKDSGIDWLGKIPKHWRMQRLSQHYHVQLGKMLDSKKANGNFAVPYLRNQDVQWGEINIKDLPLMDIDLSEREKFLLKENDLLVCEGGEIGRCAIWRHHVPCYYQKAIIRLRPRNENIDISAFMENMIFCATQCEAFSYQTGKSTIAHLPAEKISAFRFAFPPVSEQKEISQFVVEKKEAFDKIIKYTEQQINLLQEYRNSLISSVVTGQVDVRDIPVDDFDLADLVSEDSANPEEEDPAEESEE